MTTASTTDADHRHRPGDQIERHEPRPRRQPWAVTPLLLATCFWHAQAHAHSAVADDQQILAEFAETDLISGAPATPATVAALPSRPRPDRPAHRRRRGTTSPASTPDRSTGWSRPRVRCSPIGAPRRCRTRRKRATGASARDLVYPGHAPAQASASRLLGGSLPTALPADPRRRPAHPRSRGTASVRWPVPPKASATPATSANRPSDLARRSRTQRCGTSPSTPRWGSPSTVARRLGRRTRFPADAFLST
jgi:hypothetical protein